MAAPIQHKTISTKIFHIPYIRMLSKSAKQFDCLIFNYYNNNPIKNSENYINLNTKSSNLL